MSWLVASLTDWPEEECQEWGSWEYIIELFCLATVMPHGEEEDRVA